VQNKTVKVEDLQHTFLFYAVTASLVLPVFMQIRVLYKLATWNCSQYSNRCNMMNCSVMQKNVKN